MRFASIGSGSRGNATLISHKETTLLVDCGFSARETEKRLQSAKFDVSDLSGILVTHEHADHINGVRVLARKHQIPVYATPGTAAYLAEDTKSLIREFNCHESFSIDDIEVEPFPVAIALTIETAPYTLANIFVIQILLKWSASLYHMELFYPAKFQMNALLDPATFHIQK